MGRVQVRTKRAEEIREDLKKIKYHQNNTRDLEAWMALQNIVRILNNELKPKIIKKNHGELNN
jgi:hypothetical protein